MIQISKEEIIKICKEYEYDEEAHMMVDEEDERPFLIKKAMAKLDRADFIIFCLYMEPHKNILYYKNYKRVSA